MTDYLKLADDFQTAAERMLTYSPLLELLAKLGKPVQTGSSTNGLMVYPDVDFAVQTPEPKLQDAISLTSEVFTKLGAVGYKIIGFSEHEPESASYYVGIDFPYEGKTWHIDATITLPGPIGTNPPELATWLNNITQDQRVTLLKLKKELIDAGRYVGARSQPPYTFRSTHVYEGVLKGGATTIKELEAYFKD